MPEWLAWPAVKPALLRLLPGALAVIAIAAVVWRIDHAGYVRAMADRDARDARMLVQLRSDLRQSEQRLANAIDGIADGYETGRAERDRAFASLRSGLARDIVHEPRLSDPAAGLTRGMLDTINRARAAGGCATAAAGRIVCTMPAADAGH